MALWDNEGGGFGNPGQRCPPQACPPGQHWNSTTCSCIAGETRMQNTTPPAVGGENPYQVAGPGTGWAQGFGNTNWGEVRKALGMMGGMTKMDPNILNNMQNVSKLAYNMTQGFGQPSLQNYQQASDIYRNMVSGNRAMNAQFLAPEREAIADASRGAAVAISNQAGIPAAVKAQQLAELKRQEAGQTGQLSQNLLKEGTAALGQLGVQGGEIARGFASELRGAGEAAAQYHLGVEGINNQKMQIAFGQENFSRGLDAGMQTAAMNLARDYDQMNTQSRIAANQMTIDSYFKQIDYDLQNDQWKWQRDVYFPWYKQDRAMDRKAQKDAADKAKWGNILGGAGQLATGFL